MGGFINGPVVKLSVDEASLVASVQVALGKISAQAAAENKKISQGISAAIVNPLVAQAAQLRALYSTGSIGLKDLQTQQKALISLLDVQINKLATRNDLDRQSLATLKQLTLERERQQNALNRGVGVGVTAGTQSALSLVSAPIIGNISRLGTSLLGVSGASGGESSAFAGAASGIAAIAAGGGVAVTVLAGLTVGLLAAAGAATSLAISGGALVQELSNISQRTGISIQNLQVLGAVASVSNLGLGDIVIGFRKFSQALSGGGAGLDSGDGVTGATKKAAEILQVLGVTSKDSFTAIEQVADAFQKLPDGPLKSAAAVQLFGRSGLQLIPILNQGRDGVEQFRAVVEQFGPSIDQNGVKSQQNWQLATEKLSLSFQTLKVAAIPILDILSKFTTGTANFISSGFLSFADPLAKGSTSAATFGTAMDKAFTIAEDSARKFGPNLKQLTDLLDGTTDALRKLQAEGTKELQALNDEAGKGALSKLNGFSLTGERQNPNATASDNILTKQRQDLEAIAQIMLNFPNLANQVQGAVVGVTNTTISELTKLADEALKKADAADEAESRQRIENERALNAIILGFDDNLAIARAKSTKNAVQTIIAEEQKLLDDAIAKATLRGATEQSLQDLRVKANQEAELKIAKARQDEIDKTNKEIQQQAGQLFDALLKGGGNFTTALKTSLENLVLAPVKQVFEAVIAGILTKPVQAAKDELKSLGDSLKTKGGILGDIGKALSPADAIGKNAASVDLNTKSTDANTDALKNLNGILTGNAPASSAGSSSGGSLSGLGNILFGGAAAGSGGLIFHGLPPSGGGGSSSSFGGLQGAGLGLNFLLGLGNLVGGISGHNAGQAVGGGVSILGGGISKIGQIIGKSNTDLGATLGQVGGAIGGAGLVISGISQGGLGGALSATLGGAEIGTAIAPGIGTAIGAVAGFAAGLIGGLFGHHGPTAAQISAAVKRQTVDPNLLVGQEFDRSAQGTFGDTLNTTFSEGPGGTFSNSAINGPRQSPVGAVNFNINAVDAKSVADLFAQHGGTMAKIVAGRINSTQSGLARQIRTAVQPA
jgi:hypothetical protein